MYSKEKKNIPKSYNDPKAQNLHRIQEPNDIYLLYWSHYTKRLGLCPSVKVECHLTQDLGIFLVNGQKKNSNRAKNVEDFFDF